MFVAHRNPSFSGPQVEAARQFHFTDGIAEVDDLTPTEVAAIAVLGWQVVPEAIVGETDADSAPEASTDEPELTPKGKSGGRVKRTYELGETPAPEDVEKPGYEINAVVPDDEMEKPGPGIG